MENEQTSDESLGSSRTHYRHHIGILESMLQKPPMVQINPYGFWRVNFEIHKNSVKYFGISHIATGQLAALVQGENRLALELYMGDDYSKVAEREFHLQPSEVRFMVEA